VPLTRALLRHVRYEDTSNVIAYRGANCPAGPARTFAGLLETVGRGEARDCLLALSLADGGSECWTRQ
jgi:hypothetical protein